MLVYIECYNTNWYRVREELTGNLVRDGFTSWGHAYTWVKDNGYYLGH